MTANVFIAGSEVETSQTIISVDRLQIIVVVMNNANMHLLGIHELQ